MNLIKHIYPSNIKPLLFSEIGLIIKNNWKILSKIFTKDTVSEFSTLHLYANKGIEFELNEANRLLKKFGASNVLKLTRNGNFDANLKNNNSHGKEYTNYNRSSFRKQKHESDL